MAENSNQVSGLLDISLNLISRSFSDDSIQMLSNVANNIEILCLEIENTPQIDLIHTANTHPGLEKPIYFDKRNIDSLLDLSKNLRFLCEYAKHLKSRKFLELDTNNINHFLVVAIRYIHRNKDNIKFDRYITNTLIDYGNYLVKAINAIDILDDKYRLYINDSLVHNLSAFYSTYSMIIAILVAKPITDNHYVELLGGHGII